MELQGRPLRTSVFKCCKNVWFRVVSFDYSINPPFFLHRFHSHKPAFIYSINANSHTTLYRTKLSFSQVPNDNNNWKKHFDYHYYPLNRIQPDWDSLTVKPNSPVKTLLEPLLLLKPKEALTFLVFWPSGLSKKRDFDPIEFMLRTALLKVKPGQLSYKIKGRAWFLVGG